MKRPSSYEAIIGRKLNNIAAPDTSGLWASMATILDREIPQQRKKRFGGTWWFSSNVFFAFFLITAAVTLYTLCRPAESKPKQNAFFYDPATLRR